MLKIRIYSLVFLLGSLCYAADPANKIPWFGGGVGLQISFRNNFMCEIAGVRMINGIKRSERNKMNETSITYATFLFDGCVKKYWTLGKYPNWRVCLGGGGWFSMHRLYYVQDVDRLTEHNPLKIGYGGAVGGGVGYKLFSRVFFDCFITGRSPVPFFFENYIKHPSLGVKSTLSYCFDGT